MEQSKSSIQQDPEPFLAAMLEISNLVGSVMLLDDILDRIVGITASLMESPICSIFLLHKGKLVLSSQTGLDPELRGKSFYAPGEGIPGWVVQHGEVQAVADLRTDRRHRSLPSRRGGECRACLCVPLRIQEEIIGVMATFRKEPYVFSPEDVLLFETVCKQVAIVIEKSRMYQEKIRAERLAAIGVSLSGLAHYIKNILFASQVGEKMVDKGMAANDLEHIREGWKALHQSNQKIRKLVENMLNYTRESKPTRHPLDLNRQIREIVDSIRGQAQDRGIEMILKLDSNVGVVYLEAESIHDALLNLLTNAIDAIPASRKGRIEVRTAKLSGQSNLRIDVIDNGVGIPEEARERIFNLLFSTKGKQGTGIGLAATKKIVEDHGGTMEWDSQVNKGTRFTIFLPAQYEPEV